MGSVNTRNLCMVLSLALLGCPQAPEGPREMDARIDAGNDQDTIVAEDSVLAGDTHTPSDVSEDSAVSDAVTEPPPVQDTTITTEDIASQDTHSDSSQDITRVRSRLALIKSITSRCQRVPNTPTHGFVMHPM